MSEETKPVPAQPTPDERSAACSAEVNAAMAKHRCTLAFRDTTTAEGRLLRREFVFVPVE